MAGIALEGVTKVYPNGVRAVDSVVLDVEDGEFMVLVGPSGCGKSTLLRMVAGLEGVTEGRVLIGDQDVTQRPPRERDVAMVFQNYALYPHMTVRQNLGFGLKIRKTERVELARRVDEVARALGLDGLLDRKPSSLSGGQRQRVAMGRAIVREPQAFLMDEPLSNLDAKLRVSMRAELARLHERVGVTTLYVTHDQVEATTLGRRVAVLHDGVLQQCDTPQRLFDHPVNLFVASFIGSPSINLVEAEIADGAARFAGYSVPLPAGSPLAARRGRVILGVRPSDLDLAEPDRIDGKPRIRVQVELVEELGSESLVIFGVDAPPVSVEGIGAARQEDAEDEAYLFADERRSTWAARITGRRAVRAGDTIELAVNNEHCQFFDAETGLGIERGNPTAEGERAAHAH
jgi:multiple sugar transport system ATP-binding protein